MSSEERSTWILGSVAMLGYTVYLAVILSRLDGGPVVDIAHESVMLWTIGAAILAGVLGNILAAVVGPGDAGKKDQRDREVYRFGEYAGHGLLVVGAVSALAMAMLRADHFWIANVIYLAFVLSAVASAIARLVAYRRGFVSW